MDENENAKRLKKAYLKSFRRGKSGGAHLFDTLFLGLILFAALCVCVRTRLSNGTVAWAVTLVCSAAGVCLWKAAENALFEKHVRRLREETRRELAEIQLMLAGDGLWESISVDESTFVSRSAESLTADDVAKAASLTGSPVTIVTLAEPTARARRLLDALGSGIAIKSPIEFLGGKAALPEIGETEIDEAIIRRFLRPKKRRKTSIFKPGSERAVKFLAVSAGLFLLSYFVRYPLWFRAAASLTSGLGGALFTAEMIKKQGGIGAFT